MVSAPFATNNTVTKGTKLPKSRTVIRKLSFAPRSRTALSLTIAAQFLRCRRRSSLVTAVRFSNGQEALSIVYSGAKCVRFAPKIAAAPKSLFRVVKTAVLLFDCGTSTLKSPLSRAFSVSDVHPRLRKHLSRCTLDCGFKTLESPALRGFVGGPRALATAALYLVLLSNGPHRSKIQLIKFGFSPINTPANIAKKLPLQCCSKPLFIPLFNFSHKRPTFAFTSESGHTHSALGERSHTAAHRAKQGYFGWGRYHYPRSVPHVSETLRGRGLKRQTLPLLGLGRRRS